MTHHARAQPAPDHAAPDPTEAVPARPDTLHDQPEDPRPMTQAMLRGWRRRCPSCGSGPLMRGYLKVRESCPVCGEDLHHHRADDGPPYLTLLIVGHIIGPAMLWVFVAFEPDPYTFMAIFMVAATALSLWFLPRLKGVIVGVQWAARMHGFGHGDPQSDLS